MKTFIMLGWRNLWRQKRRSLVVIFSITLGVLMMMFALGLMNGIITQMLDNSISTKLGHLVVHKKGFFENMKLETNFYPDQRILRAMKSDPDIVASAPRVKAFAMIRTGESSRGLIVLGVYPELEKKVSKMNEYTLADEGGSFLDDPDANEIMISKSLAEKLDVLVGDKIVLILQDSKSEMAGVGLTVRGLFQTPVADYDNSVAYMGIKRLQNITGLGNNISEIMVVATGKEAVDSIKPRLTAAIGDASLEVMTWKDMAPNLVSAVRMIDSMLYIYYAIFFITVVFSIANTLIMSIMERFHEIGVMKSIGTRPSQIFFIIMFEAVNLGLVGLTAGIVCGVILLQVLQFTGLDFSLFMDAMRQWGAGSIIYPFLYPKDYIITILVVELTTCIAAIYPAVKAARIKPLDALHYV
ncbi:MAG: ABC transporter permease [Spirochaetes bacterium]|nr:ABC transporter permease [Spirochaetota bacterium]